MGDAHSVEREEILRRFDRGAAGRRVLTVFPPFTHPHAHTQVSCSWGFTTSGGAKGVGESTTSAVVISLVMIIVADFALSFLFFQGQGDALRSLA